MMTKRTFLYLHFLLFSFVCFGQKNLLFADSIRTSSRIPELSYAVVTGRAILEIAAIGRHSVALKDTATLQDRFHIGSNTKAMTAFMIARYVEKGKLFWTTRFFDLFPEWKNDSRPEYDRITLQDLLSHRAGIQPFQGEHDPVIPEFTGTTQQKRTSFGKFVLTLEPVAMDSLHPYIYSNAGYTLAAMMLEKATGKSWEQLVYKEFNKGLNLNAQLAFPENQSHPDTWGHYTENDQLIPVPSNTDYHLDYTEPAGDINMTLPDYVKFIQLNLKGLKGENNYLKAATYHFLHKGTEQYSLGWFSSYEDGKDFSVHSGTAGTYYTSVAIDRKNQLAFIVFTNSFNEETVNGVRQLMRRLKRSYGS